MRRQGARGENLKYSSTTWLGIKGGMGFDFFEFDIFPLGRENDF